jgi:Zn-dependent peptidase ImmA (M78 family)/DNA-binding XRE family transcriptional regulator
MESLFAQRFVSARKMAGLSLQELSDRVGNVVTKQALSKYEKGLMKPDSQILLSLAKALNVKVDYFFRRKPVELKGVEFRKKASLTKKKKEAIEQQTADFLERYLELENILNIKSEFTNPIEGIVCSNIEEVEKAAGKLLDAWDLGRNPVPNVLEMLEDKGVKVFEFSADDDFNGLSTWVNNCAVIVVNSSLDIVRKRFTAIHELAHLVLQFKEDLPEKEKERLCHCFAGAILLPGESLLEEIGANRKKFALRELIDLKEYFGISIQAIIARARNLSLIDEGTYKSFWIAWNRMGYRKNEPGEYKGKEHATRFQQLLLYAAAEGIITLNKAASLANQPLAEFEKDFVVLV